MMLLKMSSFVVTILCWTCVFVSVVYGQSCFPSSERGFAGCGNNTGSPNSPLQQLRAISASDCVRQCASNSHCSGVVVSMSGKPKMVCELYSGPPSCENTEYRVGFQYYKQIQLDRRCLRKSPEVKAAVRVNDTYILFYDDTLQTFRLDRDGLYATACPVRYADYWWVWPIHAQLNAAAFSNVFNGKFRLYLIFGSSVHHGFLESRIATFNGLEDVSSFFGPGLPGDIRAIASEGETFYVFTPDGVYVRSPLWNGTDISIGPKYNLTDTAFDWSDLTAATLTSDPEVMLIFARNRYFLFDMDLHVSMDSGNVCTNIYQLEDGEETLGLPKKPSARFSFWSN